MGRQSGELGWYNSNLVFNPGDAVVSSLLTSQDEEGSMQILSPRQSSFERPDSNDEDIPTLLPPVGLLEKRTQTPTSATSDDQGRYFLREEVPTDIWEPSTTTADLYRYMNPLRLPQVKPVLSTRRGRPKEPGVRTEILRMVWGVSFYTVRTVPTTLVKEGSILRLDGALVGRWTAEVKAFEKGGFAFVRMKEKDARQLALVAIPCSSVEMMGPHEKVDRICQMLSERSENLDQHRVMPMQHSITPVAVRAEHAPDLYTYAPMDQDM
ncbi:hypothetical protein C8R44DRAFT_103876 [Mycena epipterygia]|nr:hypothetical protein C8R44DRAFT_103876 [Mycena epipterygia]